MCQNIRRNTFQKKFPKVKSVPTKRAPDVWDSAAFSSIFLASSFPCSRTESQPAHTQVTHTVSVPLRVKPLGLFFKFMFQSSLVWVFKIRFRVFSKSIDLFKSGLLAVESFQILSAWKLAHVFGSKSFVSNLLRFLKSVSRFSGKVFASRQFLFSLFSFSGLRFVGSSQVFKIGFNFSAKVSASLVRAFLPGLFFLAK